MRKAECRCRNGHPDLRSGSTKGAVPSTFAVASAPENAGRRPMRRRRRKGLTYTTLMMCTNSYYYNTLRPRTLPPDEPFLILLSASTDSFLFRFCGDGEQCSATVESKITARSCSTIFPFGLMCRLGDTRRNGTANSPCRRTCQPNARVRSDLFFMTVGKVTSCWTTGLRTATSKRLCASSVARRLHDLPFGCGRPRQALCGRERGPSGLPSRGGPTPRAN